MAIPNERILAYMDNCLKLNSEWLEELNRGGVSARRAHEIQRDSKLVGVIFKCLSYQYAVNKLEEME